MKKFFILLVIVFVIFALTSCNLKTQSYSVLLNTNIAGLTSPVGNTFKYNSFEKTYSFSSDGQKIKKNVPSRVFSYGETKYEIEYSESYEREYNEETIDVFEVPGTRTEFAFYEKTGKLADIYAPDTVIKIVDGEPLGETDYIEICEKIAPEICNNKEYVMSCETYSVVKDKKGVWTEKKEGFVSKDELPDNSTTYYRFTYLRYFEGIPSDDSVYIELKADGSIKMVLFNTLDTYKDFNFSLVEAREILDEKIKKLCNRENFSLEDYKLEESFVSFKGKVALLATVEPSVKDLSSQKVFNPSPVTLLVIEE